MAQCYSLSRPSCLQDGAAEEREKRGSATINVVAIYKNNTTVETRADIHHAMHEIMQVQGPGMIDDPGRSWLVLTTGILEYSEVLKYQVD